MDIILKYSRERGKCCISAIEKVSSETRKRKLDTVEDRRRLYRSILEGNTTRKSQNGRRLSPTRVTQRVFIRTKKIVTLDNPIKEDRERAQQPRKVLVRFRTISAKELLRRKSEQTTRESKQKVDCFNHQLVKRQKGNDEMSQLSSAFRALKQQDYEKSDAIFNKPLIRFYPNQSRLKTAKKQSTELKVDPTDKANENTFKVHYQIFETGTVEDLIEWKAMLRNIIERKPIENAPGQFLMTRNMLEGAAKSKFDTLAAKVCAQSGTDADGKETAPPGRRR